MQSRDRMKIIHILPHNLFKFFPNVYTDIDNISKIDHHLTRFIESIDNYKDWNDIVQELWTIWDVKEIIEKKHELWFIIKIFPQDFKSFLPLETCFSIFFEIKEVIRNWEKIIWHVHSYYLWMFEFIVIYLRVKKQIIFAHHRWGWFTFRALPYSIYKYILILPLVLRLCNYICPQNRVEYNKLKSLYLIDETKLIYMSNWVSVIDTYIDKVFDEQKVNIFFLWRLIWFKWIDYILDTLKYLKENWVNFKMTFIWEWDSRLSIENFCSLYEIDFEITWWISKKQIKDIATYQDIMLIASTKPEWSSNAVLEAQSCWIPVVAFDIAWIKDFVIDWKTWFLIKNKDLVEYKSKVFLLAKNKNLIKDFSNNSFENIRKNFDKKVFFNNLINCYKKFL